MKFGSRSSTAEKCLSILTCFLFVRSVISSLETIVVTTDGGKIRGFVNTTTNNRFVSFLGIPYALPPIKNLRFRAPVPFPNWSFTINATRYQRECMRREDWSSDIIMSEDCLYLNVLIPNENFTKAFNPLTVVVYLSAVSDATEKQAVSQFAAKNDVIVVTLNSRLDIFGFLSLGEDIRGNFGLLDQNLALKWIKQNIKSFGGDSNNIVIFGERKIISLHIVSALNHGLFKSVVAYEASFSRNPVQIGYSDASMNSKYFKHLCTAKSGHVVIESCLRNARAEDLLNITIDTKFIWQPSAFLPVLDNVFLTELPVKTFSDGKQNPVDYMVLNIKDQIKYSRNVFTNLTCNMKMLIDAIDFITDQINMTLPLIQETLKSIYYPEQNTSDKICYQLWKLSDDFQTMNILNEIDEHSRSGLTFLFVDNMVTNCTTIQTRSTTYKGHMDTAIWCVFYDQTSERCNTSRKMFDSLQEKIQSFIKHSYPLGGDGIIWRPYTKNSKNYLSYDHDVVKQGNIHTWPYNRLEQLWRIYLPQISTTVTGMKQNNNHNMDKLKTHFESNWGLGQHQVEALVFSLILVSLFLLCINIALFRIICYVKGKPFLHRTKERKQTQQLSEIADRQVDRCNGHVPRGNNSVEETDVETIDDKIIERTDTSRL